MSWGWSRLRGVRAAAFVGRNSWAVLVNGAEFQGGQSTDWRQAMIDAAHVLKAAGGRPHVQVWLSGALCPAIWVIPPQGLRNGDEWRAWLSASVASQHPMCGPQDSPLIWIDSSAWRPALVAALPSACMKALEEEMGFCRLHSVKPAWSHAFCRFRAGTISGPQRWAVFDGEALTSVDVAGAALNGASTLDGVDILELALSIHQRRLATLGVERSDFWRIEQPELLTAGARFPQPVWSEVEV